MSKSYISGDKFFIAAALLTLLASCANEGQLVVAPPLLISQSDWGPFIVGLPLNDQIIKRPPTIRNIGGPPLVSGGCRVSPSLPSGLLFLPTTTNCVLSGQPREVTASSDYQLTVSNISGSDEITVNFEIIRSPPVFTPPTSTVVYSGLSLFLVNRTGEAMDSCVFKPGTPSFPAGVMLDLSNNKTSCRISGRPSGDLESQEQTYTLLASNSVGVTEVMLMLEFSTLVPSFTNAQTVQNYTVGQEVSFLIVNSGSPVNTCSISPALPNLLTIEKDSSGLHCEISGTAQMPADQQTYTITASNSAGSGTARVSIVVVDPNP